MSGVMIVGGGTAGHVLPGVAIGRELVDRGHPIDTIRFVGSERGVDRELVPAAGFDLTVLPGRGIQRRLTAENLQSTRDLLRAAAQARKVLAGHDPDVVVALGGYASVPAGAWAVLRRIPVVVAEQNAVPGLANRLLGRFAQVSAVSFEGTDLPRAVWTGNPVRPEILEVAAENDRTDRRERVGVAAGRRLVVVFGGSLGARRINEAVLDALPALSGRDDLAIRHIVGRRDHADVTSRVPDLDGAALAYEAVEYEDDMATVLAAADLVVSRAGATTCAELTVVGRPAVLVPLPGAPGDHQTANARALEATGGAELVADAILDGALLVATLDRLLADPDRLRNMGDSMRSIARPDAASAVVDLIEKHLEGGHD